MSQRKPPSVDLKKLSSPELVNQFEYAAVYAEVMIDKSWETFAGQAKKELIRRFAQMEKQALKPPKDISISQKKTDKITKSPLSSARKKDTPSHDVKPSRTSTSEKRRATRSKSS